MQSVNGAQFLNITSLFILHNHFALSSAHATVIVTAPLNIIYASLQSHTRDFSIAVSNLI